MYSKKELRQSIKEKRRLLSAKEREQAGEAVKNRIISLPEYRSCEQLFLYVSCTDELPTLGLMEQGVADGKQIAVPKVLSERKMEFYQITSLSELQPGKWGILEPVKGEKCIPQPERKPLMLLPGLAFSSQGARLGYGGGYYDSYLAECALSCPELCKAAIGYDFSLVSELPEEKFDIRVDLIVTPGMLCRTTEI